MSSENPRSNWGKRIVIGTTVGLVTVAGTAAYDHHVSKKEPINLPGITRDIKAIPGQVVEWFKGGPVEEIPPTYDTKAAIQTVAPGTNTITVGSAELPSVLKDSLKPVEAGKYPDESILFPVKAGNQKIVSSKAYLDGLRNPFTDQQENHAVEGKILKIPNKGTELIVPVEGAEVFQLTPRSRGSGESYFRGVVVRFKGPDGAFHYLNIESSDDKLGQVALSDAAKNAPFIGINGFFGIPTAETDALKGMSLPVGTPILKTAIDNAGVQFFLTTFSPIIPYPGRAKSDFNFVTQDGKIVITP